MAQLLTLNLLGSPSSIRPDSIRLQPLTSALYRSRTSRIFTTQPQHLKRNSKFTCRSSREEQARKALESALGGRKNEFSKWDKEIKRRGERGGGGGGSRGGGWFGSGGSFGWFNNDSFWQTILTVLVIILVYLIVMKRELLLAFIENPFLCLRGARDGLTSLMGKIYAAKSVDTSYREEYQYRPLSAKERVLRKWGSDS